MRRQQQLGDLRRRTSRGTRGRAGQACPDLLDPPRKRPRSHPITLSNTRTDRYYSILSSMTNLASDRRPRNSSPSPGSVRFRVRIRACLRLATELVCRAMRWRLGARMAVVDRDPRQPGLVSEDQPGGDGPRGSGAPRQRIFRGEHDWAMLWTSERSFHLACGGGSLSKTSPQRSETR